MLNDRVYVLGHRNPDTDSVCSAIAYAELKRKLGMSAVAGRLGDLNQETKFVLRHFEVELPPYIENVKKQVSDLDMDPIQILSPDTSIKKTWTLMHKTNLKSLPVVDENEKLIGIVTLSDITKKYMDTVDQNIMAVRHTSLRNLSETLEAKIIYGEQKDYSTTGKIHVLVSEPSRFNTFIQKGDIVISANRADSVTKAMELGANCIILTCSTEVDPVLVQAAQNHHCILMTTMMNPFTATRLITQSIPIRHVMTTDNIIKFEGDDYVEEVKETMLSTRYRSYPVVDSSNKVIGSISRFHVISPHKKKVILVDHNEKSQTVAGIEEADILEIIDHHRLGDIQTGTPIFFKNEPVGATATLIANMYFDNGITPSLKMAGIMCSAILSDTLKFKSPTCTYLDRVTAEKLAELAGLEIESYALQMFKEGSTLKGKTPEEILSSDFKTFALGKHRIGIGQVYTIDIESVEDIRAETLQHMETICKDKGYNLVVLLITDIINEGSELLFVGHLRDMVGRAFGVQTHENRVYLPGVMSRKKQIVPQILQALEL